MKLKKYSFIGLTLSLLLIVSQSSVLAKGGGGGSAPAVCTNDTWTCEKWSDCSAGGEQSRTCELINDCEGVEQAEPTVSRSCEPPAPEPAEETIEVEVLEVPEDEGITASEEPEEEVKAVIEESKPVPTPIKEVVPEPIPELIAEPPLPTCNDDSYCEDWGVCEENGVQNRVCNVPNKCTPPMPAQQQVCPGLICGHLETVEERIRCRIQLSESELRKEQKILYSPEYCRVEETAQEKAECINLYWAFERCWAMPAGKERQKCGWEASGMDDFEDEKEECMEEEDKTECSHELKEKAENLLLFEMYELEFLAEELWKEGRVELEPVVQLDVEVEKLKAAIEDDERVSAWKKLAEESKVLWQNFINDNIQ